MTIEPFALERLQSLYEHEVEINLSESGVEPLRLDELLRADDLGRLLREPLGYPQTNGTAALRELVAADHPGASADHVLITAGSAEANFLACWRLVEPGDEVVVLHPNYLQTHLLAASHGAQVRRWPLRLEGDGEGARWAPALDALDDLVTERTRLVVLCNPNNPTGARLTADEVDAVCAAAARHGAWVLSDEVYRGAERDGRLTASAWGRYDRALVTGGLSKAYGLAGLRIGWVVAPPTLTAESLEPARLHDHRPGRPERPARPPGPGPRHAGPAAGARAAPHRGALRHRPRLDRGDRRRAGARRLRRPAPSCSSATRRRFGRKRVVTRLRETASVLVAPGAHFGLDGYLRIGFGGEEPALRAGLERLGRLLARLPQLA